MFCEAKTNKTSYRISPINCGSADRLSAKLFFYNVRLARAVTFCFTIERSLMRREEKKGESGLLCNIKAKDMGILPFLLQRPHGLFFF